MAAFPGGPRIILLGPAVVMCAVAAGPPVRREATVKLRNVEPIEPPRYSAEYADRGNARAPIPDRLRRRMERRRG
jgi:hypothetical protein